MYIPRICMLGWEFPPFLNGGLGVACQGIAEALSAKAELRMIVPKTSGQYQADGWDLVGVHGRSIEAVYQTNVRTEQDLLTQVRLHYIDVEIAGYERMERSVDIIEEEEQFLVEKVFYEEELMRPASIFRLQELYGDDLFDRVIEFAEIAVEVAMEEEFDLIHVHDWMTFLAGMRLKAISGKPLVLHIHSLEYDRAGPQSKGWIYELERHAMTQADLILPVSQYTADIIEKHYKIPTNRITVIHNGINPYEAYQAHIPFRGALVAFLGRLTGQKGPEYFFDMARHLIDEDRDIHFIIAGRGHLIDILKEKTYEQGLGDKIHFTGFLEPDRVKDLLAMANVYVMPSVSEPFGLSALEAAQMGVPCVISNQAGVGEVLEGALKTDYWETEEMAKLVGRLLDEDKLRKKVIEDQFQNISGVSWDDTVDRILNAYQDILPSI